MCLTLFNPTEPCDVNARACRYCSHINWNEYDWLLEVFRGDEVVEARRLFHVRNDVGHSCAWSTGLGFEEGFKDSEGNPQQALHPWMLLRTVNGWKLLRFWNFGRYTNTGWNGQLGWNWLGDEGWFGVPNGWAAYDGEFGFGWWGFGYWLRFGDYFPSPEQLEFFGITEADLYSTAVRYTVIDHRKPRSIRFRRYGETQFARQVTLTPDSTMQDIADTLGGLNLEIDATRFNKPTQFWLKYDADDLDPVFFGDVENFYVEPLLQTLSYLPLMSCRGTPYSVPQILVNPVGLFFESPVIETHKLTRIRRTDSPELRYRIYGGLPTQPISPFDPDPE